MVEKRWSGGWGVITFLYPKYFSINIAADDICLLQWSPKSLKHDYAEEPVHQEKSQNQGNKYWKCRWGSILMLLVQNEMTWWVLVQRGRVKKKKMVWNMKLSAARFEEATPERQPKSKECPLTWSVFSLTAGVTGQSGWQREDWNCLDWCWSLLFGLHLMTHWSPKICLTW